MSVSGNVVNAVAYGIRHTVTAAEASAGTISFTFVGGAYDVGFSVRVSASNINVPLVDAVITYTARVAPSTTFTLTVANGALTFALVAGQVIDIIGVPVN
jgi:hypothetical protein